MGRFSLNSNDPEREDDPLTGGFRIALPVQKPVSQKRHSNRQAVGYCRVCSSDGISLVAQNERIQAFCIEQGLILVQVFEDSGSSPSINNELVEVLEYCRDHPVSALVVTSLDRLCQSEQMYLSVMHKLRRLGVNLLVVERPSESKPVSELVERIMASVGEYEASVLSKRTKAGMKRARRAGKYTSRPPIGYRVQRVSFSLMEPDDTESVLVQTVFSLALELDGNLRRLSDNLELKGIRNPRTGKPFSRRSLRHMLSNCT